MTVVCILPGPDKLMKSEPDDRERWCFKCRHRHVHTWELWGDSEPSYYDPVWIRCCPHCHNDYTAFPGSAL